MSTGYSQTWQGKYLRGLNQKGTRFVDPPSDLWNSPDGSPGSSPKMIGQHYSVTQDQSVLTTVRGTLRA